MDLSLLITLAVIFLVTLVGSALRGMRTDRCLRDFDEFQVTVERAGRRPVYGRMCLAPTGFELSYRVEVLDEQMHTESSYVYYSAEYASIVGIYRYVDELTPENRERRDRAWRVAFRPNLPRRLWRKFTNFVNTATDSLVEAFSLVLGRAQVAGQKPILTQGERKISGLTKDVLGAVGTSFDPLLERLMGQEVVVELVREKGTVEYVGILKSYTADFLEILDVYVPEPISFKVERGGARRASLGRDYGDVEALKAARVVAGNLDLALDESGLVLTNLSERPMLLSEVCTDAGTKRVNALVDSGGTVHYPLDAQPEQVQVSIMMALRFDLVLPRRIALIRHRAARYHPREVFGSPLVLQRAAQNEDDEREMRERLEQNPSDAEAALHLGILLLGRDEVAEAGCCFQTALRSRDSLADGGSLARLLLEIVQREQHRLDCRQDLLERAQTQGGQGPPCASSGRL